MFVSAEFIGKSHVAAQNSGVKYGVGHSVSLFYFLVNCLPLRN
jgi:hypothetical protein